MLEVISVLLIAEIALLAYVITIWGEFVFDDLLVLEFLRYTHHKQTIRTLWNQKRALLWLTYQRDMLLHAYNPQGWHSTNLAIHVVVSVTMYAILRYWFATIPALLGASIVAVHPLGTSSVSSISGRSSALCTMFLLMSVVAWLAGAWLMIPLLAYCGFKSKEEILILPVTLGALWLFG